MPRTYIGIAFVMMTACLGLGEVESNPQPNPGGGGTLSDAGWPDSPAETGAECDAGTKLCGSNCVPFDDPNFGCTPEGCTPCPLGGAVMFCMNLACKLDSCLTGRDDCDGIETNGCETDLTTDPQNCGECGNTCAAVNGTAACVDGVCQLTCDTGFGNCDNDPSTGCETSLTTNQHCGSCPKKCGTGFNCQNADCHCVNNASCDGGSFGACTGGICFCSGGIPCTGGKKCTPAGCQ